MTVLLLGPLDRNGVWISYWMFIIIFILEYIRQTATASYVQQVP